MTGTSQSHLRWLSEVQREIGEEYQRLREAARSDPQRSGHGGEETWSRLLEEWLPPRYEVGTRKYIIPEVDDDMFETDIVVFRPSYPRRLRQRSEVMAGGVAAAFSVKLTLDAAGIADAYQRSARIKKHLQSRNGTPYGEMVGPFPYGLLAHSHDWKAPGSEPLRNIALNAEVGHDAVVESPLHALDYICVGDLGTWCEMRVPYIPPYTARQAMTVNPVHCVEGFAMSSLTGPTVAPAVETSPVGTLLSYLYVRLSYSDPELQPMADGFRVTGTMGTGGGQQRHWTLGQVFSPEVAAQLPTRGLSQSELRWTSAFM